MKESLISFIKEKIEEYNYRGAVVGVSGGVDSAVVLSLCVQALGKDRVFALILPERDSSKDSLKDAVDFCERLGVEYRKRSITPILRKIGVYRLFPPRLFLPDSIVKRYVLNRWNTLSKDPFLDDLRNTGPEEFLKGLAYYRIKHRIRMCLLYFEAEKRGYAVVGTTNRTEYLTGLYVKWGDEAVDIEPIMHLYKTQVFELAKEMNVPEKILKKPPSPDLIPGITDEMAFNMSYLELDRILMKLEKNEDLSDEDPKKVERVKKILELSEKYRRDIPITFDRI
ncbi:NAD synthetase [Thermotoga maritima MSB8]|uniref:NH(3)-dependent NAD(+) synthetase n=1 Tax=Thermotoga maritima (strain ATCC 43589 / DSM 3109 / JCM 10099 / NBRC 100826 / MSB8) TaxID=243274 RepID=NADE1_THEMA|nr:NAD(+) synthase [Thermotoga maritima]Q9WZB3.1 RecName: Full=NH(3)-dependent NAD(+) synthetase [Thermotoga maritima MSB8]AAD35729.1 NH(3)-dependent NAD(+) synthetase, putative [Thermotoga maritima MSB8]AGL49570.1 NAD synthetase [Thermotoga maritima MSB8]AHD17601.1 NAD synthetase [Thermotoga maritima MSB8]AKE26566.1 NAD synthetase [Thermotoga maritima]AKE28431.1 NAD synthetase [Thermotoga maritima MSB8]